MVLEYRPVNETRLSLAEYNSRKKACTEQELARLMSTAEFSNWTAQMRRKAVMLKIFFRLVFWTVLLISLYELQSMSTFLGLTPRHPSVNRPEKQVLHLQHIRGKDSTSGTVNEGDRVLSKTKGSFHNLSLPLKAQQSTLFSGQHLAGKTPSLELLRGRRMRNEDIGASQRIHFENFEFEPGHKQHESSQSVNLLSFEGRKQCGLLDSPETASKVAQLSFSTAKECDCCQASDPGDIEDLFEKETRQLFLFFQWIAESLTAAAALLVSFQLPAMLLMLQNIERSEAEDAEVCRTLKAISNSLESAGSLLGGFGKGERLCHTIQPPVHTVLHGCLALQVQAGNLQKQIALMSSIASETKEEHPAASPSQDVAVQADGPDDLEQGTAACTGDVAEQEQMVKTIGGLREEVGLVSSLRHSLLSLSDQLSEGDGLLDALAAKEDLLAQQNRRSLQAHKDTVAQLIARGDEELQAQRSAAESLAVANTELALRTCCIVSQLRAMESEVSTQQQDLERYSALVAQLQIAKESFEEQLQDKEQLLANAEDVIERQRVEMEELREDVSREISPPGSSGHSAGRLEPSAESPSFSDQLLRPAGIGCQVRPLCPQPQPTRREPQAPEQRRFYGILGALADYYLESRASDSPRP